MKILITGSSGYVGYVLSRYFSERGINVVGLDISKKEANKLKNKGYSILLGNAETKKINKKFDVIVAAEIIEHLSNPGLFLNNMKGHLKKNGCLVITTPNCFAIRYVIRNMIFDKVIPNPDHACYYDFYTLKLLNPSFDLIFGDNDRLSIPQNYAELEILFDSIEPGSSQRLNAFMREAEYKYQTGMENLVYKPGLSLMEFADINLIKGALRLQVFSAFSRHVRKYFRHPKLISLMEFPVLFLGAMPEDTPALYSLMNYAGLKLGTWYPEGGFGSVVKSMMKIGFWSSNTT